MSRTSGVGAERLTARRLTRESAVGAGQRTARRADPRERGGRRPAWSPASPA